MSDDTILVKKLNSFNIKLSDILKTCKFQINISPAHRFNCIEGGKQKITSLSRVLSYIGIFPTAENRPETRAKGGKSWQQPTWTGWQHTTNHLSDFSSSKKPQIHRAMPNLSMCSSMYKACRFAGLAQSYHRSWSCPFGPWKLSRIFSTARNIEIGKCSLYDILLRCLVHYCTRNNSIMTC